jgi:hypothetical protein
MLRVEDTGRPTTDIGDAVLRPVSNHQQSGAVWRKCHEFAVVVSHLEHLEARTQRAADANGQLHALWRKRAELANEIVAAVATTIKDVILKMTMTASLLSRGELRLGLTLQCLEECDLALTDDQDGEQCLRVLEPDLWALSVRVERQVAELETEWNRIETDNAAGRCDEAEAAFMLERVWQDLSDSIWNVARYEAMTAVGLRAKGKMFRDLWEPLNSMESLLALQDSYLRDFEHLAYRRMSGGETEMPRRMVG